MPATLRTENFDPVLLQATTLLDASAAAGSTSVQPHSYSDLNLADFAALGRLGGENCEIVSLGAPGQSTGVSPATRYVHQRGEQLTSLRANQIKLYRAPNVDGSYPSDSSFVVVGSPVAIDAQAQFTDLVDPAGDATFWYKSTYYNSATGWESDIADCVAAAGEDSGHYVTLDDIRSEAGLRDAKNVSETDVSFKRDDAEAEVNAMLVTMFSLPLSDPYPPLVVSVTRRLAGGFLLLKQYGIPEQGGEKDGSVMVNDARDTLDRIRSRELTLVDYRGNVIQAVPSFNGWPDDSTATYNDSDDLSDPVGGDRMFRASQIF